MTDTPTRHCAQCQQPLQDTDQFCGGCGAPVAPKAEPAQTPAPTTSQPAPPGNTVTGCILLLVVAAVLVWGIWGFVGICHKANQKALAYRATAHAHRATSTTPRAPAQPGTVTIDAESGKVTESAPASQTVDTTSLRTFALAVTTHAAAIADCEGTLVTLLNHPHVGEADWTDKMAAQLAELYALADKGLAITTENTACQPALQRYHQAMSEYKHVANQLPQAIDAGSTDELNASGQQLQLAGQHVGQALDLVQSLVTQMKGGK